jgi:plasmid stabilization system protein ParE
MARATFHPLAERELVDAASYYELESPGLGVSFLDAAERCERAIIEHPHAGTPIQDDVRRRLLRAFPYAFLYKVGPASVRILAVMNLKRRPLYWINRE